MAYSDYSPLFSQAEQKYGLRPGTGSALMSLEDASGNPYARSPKGAQGVLQLMPGTAAEMGVSNPNDPAANIDGGLHYFSNILNGPAHGDYRTAAMGYNAGPNRSSFPSASQSYADQFMSRLPQGQSQPQPGGQMPPQPPMSLGQMAGASSPVNMNASPMNGMPQTLSLGQMASSMPGVPTRAPSKFNAGNILGVLGDSLMAYDKMPPAFAPFMREQQMAATQHSYDMEKFQQQIAMQLAMMRNGLDTETGKTLLASGVQPGTPQWQSAMATAASNSLNPVVNTAQGPVLRSSVVPRYPTQAVAMLRQAMASGDHAAAQEFDEHFGNGASLQALGQQ